MKTLFASLLLSLLSPSLSHAEKCTGKDPCTACKDCTQCDWCAKKGQSCGVMRDQNGAAANARDTKRAKNQPKTPAK